MFMELIIHGHNLLKSCWVTLSTAYLDNHLGTPFSSTHVALDSLLFVYYYVTS